MFPEAVRKKLDFFNKDKYTIATEEVDLKEKKKYGEALKIIREWKKGKCSLDLDSRNSVFPHEKIQLDQDGKGECVLKQ